MQAQVRGRETFVQPLGHELDETLSTVNSIDYFMNLTQDNENSYSGLRISTPAIIADSASLITGLESQDMCLWLVDDAYVKDYNLQANETGTQKTQATLAQLTDACRASAGNLLHLGLQQSTNTILQSILQGTIQLRQTAGVGGLLKFDKEQQLLAIVQVRLRFMNRMDRALLLSIKQSILSYFDRQQANYVIVFTVFLVLVVVAMVVLSYYGVEYLFKNLIAIKFILNFIPGQWLIENNAADDLKYVEF